MGLLKNPSNTYQYCDSDPIDIINYNITLCKSFNLSTTDSHHSLPFMFWTPKMHKTPSGARFIVASAVCSTKPISNVVSVIFRKIFLQIQSFHSKCLFYQNYNRFWVIQNSKTLINRLNKLNQKHNAKMISTFDFSTLYTKLPHSDLIRVLSNLIDLVFNGGGKTDSGNRKYLTVKGKSCYFTRHKHGNDSYTKNQIKMLVKHLILETYFQIGNMLFRQCIGIPWGLTLLHSGQIYIYISMRANTSLSLSSPKIVKCDSEALNSKILQEFIDDCCNLNDNNAFSLYHKDIYPPELELKCEHSGNHATFLELDIQIIGNQFVYKLFDKRDAFPFSIVRMPVLGGNIPSQVFYGSIFSEYLRIARATLKYQDFLPKAKELLNRMINQGAVENILLKQINKLLDRHPDAFESFNVNSKTIKGDLRN